MVWKNAMLEELNAIKKNNTWELVDLPNKKRAIGVKWMFKLKLNPNNTVAKHKVRLVARGFLQKPGIDYSEVYAPVARIETVRLVVEMASNHNWALFHMDVKSVFLNGPLEESVFVTQPPGFVKEGMEDKVYRLNKALYGLKQARRAWNRRIDTFLIQSGFKKCSVEYGVYVKKETSVILICLYEDDLLVTGNELKGIEFFKAQMMQEFDMTNLGTLAYFLGLGFVTTSKRILLH